MTRRARLPAAVLSPADVAAGRGGRGEVRVGGRVASAHGTEVVLGDATTAIRVRLRSPASLAPGELVVVLGRRVGKGLSAARIAERYPGATPALESEQGRLTLAGVGPHLVARSRALRVVRAFFDSEGFVEVETPVRVPTPGLDAHVDAIPAEGGHLITSPELHMKRLVVGGLHRVYQLARASRRDEAGALHEPEFTLLEWYRAFSGMEAVLRDTERLVHAVVVALSGRASVKLGRRRIDVRPPFARLTVREAFRRHARVADAATLAEADEDRYFQVFVDHVEPALARSTRPLVLTEFPATQAALARPCAHDPRVAERFELYVAGVELCNGFGELTDPKEQRRRFLLEQERRRRAGAPVYPLPERFLAALAEGLPPSGGNALGLDRLVALALGAKNVADVMAFPRAWA